MVAPRGRTKLDTSFFTPNLLVHSMLKGSVPTLLALENANSIASLISLKNRIGLIFPIALTALEYTTTIWIMLTRYATPINFRSGSSTDTPLVAMTGVISPNTPIGENLIIIPMTLIDTSEKLSMTEPASFPFSPAIITPNPKNRAITIIWSMVASASGCTALDGNMLTMVSINDGLSTASNPSSIPESNL